MNMEQFKEISNQLGFIYTSVEAVKVDYVEIEGEKYYLNMDYDKYNAGEVISIDTILRQGNYDYINTIEEILCIFLRKKINDKIEPFTTDLFIRKELFKKLNISEVNNVFSFFLSGGNSSGKTTKDYTKKKFPKKKVSLRKR